jgi:hypothetical protein
MAAGCGTTRMTDTQRTATEQLLVSNAIDQAVSALDFSEMAGKPVYFDVQYVDGAVDRGYLVSSLRQALLARGCLLEDERTKATYVIEVRSGGIGTDRHAVLVGIPQMTVPAFVPGQPSQIPEIPLAKKTDQEGVAKIAIFAYNRLTGRLVWQSGVVQATSTSKDTWVLGAGPFQQGTIRNGTEFAGEPLLLPHFVDKDANADESEAPATREGFRLERAGPAANSKRLAYVLGNAPIEGRPTAADPEQTVLGLLLGQSASDGSPNRWPWTSVVMADGTTPSTAPPSAAKPATAAVLLPVVTPLPETEPSGIVTSGLGTTPGNPQAESEPRIILDFATGMKPVN